ncbi:VacJ protein (plasmid) [Azospirillum sp. B510]|uniref:MlaA family lipoprotein n=1 Tax=Azospirillum sp. (strain B510) TaxID=137722 RepID=UPI0001C4C8D0|nr:MlaA family lipoprotein [Azospirillum sp. B510]BAI75161.1 VacJ protein [Azospirillum sp. B510]
MAARHAAGLIVTLALSCIPVAGQAADPVTDPPGDPYESFNRAMFAVNKGLVDWVINPTVEHVGPWLPAPVATGLSNAYANLTEIEMILDNGLQGKADGAVVSAARFGVNSTLGIGGLFDVATPLGLERREANFGVSLCKTGLAPGSYLVLPLVGPTNTVGAVALTAGIAAEVYALSFISTTLATVDFLVIDLGGSASALRHARNVPLEGEDLYAVQREDYRQYIEGGCAAAQSSS